MIRNITIQIDDNGDKGCNAIIQVNKGASRCCGPRRHFIFSSLEEMGKQLWVAIIDTESGYGQGSCQVAESVVKRDNEI